MSTIALPTNVKDRVFVIQSDKVCERRYIGNGWAWVPHQALNSYLDTLDLQGLGPCMVNT